MEGNMNFAEGITQVVNQICSSLKETPHANTVILSTRNTSENLEAGFNALVAIASVQSGKKLTAKIQEPTEEYAEGSVHLAFINDGTQSITLNDIFQNK